MAKENTKAVLLEYLKEQTGSFSFEQADMLTTNEIAQAIYTSRSLASQYLNELVKTGVLIKTNSRPTYFFHCKVLEKRFRLKNINEEFYSISELKAFIEKGENSYRDLVGHDKSLAPVISCLQESIEYPPGGLPALLSGPVGSGKRTISRTVARNSIRSGGVDPSTQLEQLDATQEDFESLVFGEAGLLQKGKKSILIIDNAEKMTNSQQERFCNYLNHPHTAAKLIFLTAETDNSFLLNKLSKNLPVVIRVPGFQERSYDEREELVMYFLKEESARIGRDIYINSATLRVLVKADYTGNIQELKNVLRQLCAWGNAAGHGGDITLESKGLPEELLKILPVSTNDQTTYLHVGSYRFNEKTGLFLECFSKILTCFAQGNGIETQIQDGIRAMEPLMDHFLYDRTSDSIRLSGIEKAMTDIIDMVMKQYFISVSSEFSFIASKLFYYCDKYPNNIDNWMQDHEKEVHRLNNHLLGICINEGIAIQEIVAMVRKSLGIKIYSMIPVALLLVLAKYRQQFSPKKYIGLIACHGLSTATSIANAVNSLLEAHIYDAIDMPLNVNADQILHILIDRLNRFSSRADAIILVDMGSLEFLGESLSKHMNRRIGVINNVSTRTALHVGHELLGDKDMELILKSTAEENQIEYTIMERRANQKILFVSESGLHTAKRMRDLFQDSLPEDIPITCKACDFSQLAHDAEAHTLYSPDQILFISGTANPNIEGIPFVSLEEIIDNTDNPVIKSCLKKYLQPNQMEQMIHTLRTKFTLQNIVGYLTILNPQVLLDNVTRSVERLQGCMGRKFKGRTLVGIYIHVCCLVERLVTKTPIQDGRETASFAAEQDTFIKMINRSFSNIMDHYGVEIPLNEISYLYDFIVADDARQEIGENQENEPERT